MKWVRIIHEEGWYWFKLIKNSTPIIIRIEFDPDEGGWFTTDCEEIEYPRGWFAGPIPEPEE